MAIRPSTSETRGRSLASKPLSASNSGSRTSDESDGSSPELSPKDGPDCSAPNEEVHLPKNGADDASPTTPEFVDNVQNEEVHLPKDDASPTIPEFVDNVQNEEVHLPKDDASPTTPEFVDNVQNEEVHLPKDDVSPTTPEFVDNSQNEEVHLPKDDVSLEFVDNTQNDDVIKPRDFASDSEFWLHMTTTLEACFSSTKSNNEDEPDAASNDLLADAPRIMQTFLSHGDACTKIEAQALDLVSNGSFSHEEEPLKVYNLMLVDLEQLQEKATSLETSISRLAGLAYESDRDEHEQDELAGSKLAAHSELRRVFTACLPVLRARKANLTMAQDLIDSAQENVSISLKMEYLGID